mgnify:CR=1 FL=1
MTAFAYERAFALECTGGLLRLKADAGEELRMTDARDSKINLKRRTIVAGAVAMSAQLLSPVSALSDTKRTTSTRSQRMDIDRFVADCIAANDETDAQLAVNEVLARAVSKPDTVLAALGDPDRA